MDYEKVKTFPRVHKQQVKSALPWRERSSVSEIDFCDLGHHGCQHDCLSPTPAGARGAFGLNLDGKTCSSECTKLPNATQLQVGE